MNNAHLAAHSLGALSLAMLMVGSGTALASPGGRLGTLPNGSYSCALPGSADGPAVRPVAERDFKIIHTSSYIIAGKQGIYLLVGKDVRFTSGPMKGQHFRRTGGNTIRLIGADGKLAQLRCTRRPS